RRQPVTTVPDSPRTDEPPETSFADFSLPKPLRRQLNNDGLTKPFAIQAAILPDALAGHDVLGRAETGSGKTLAFGLAVLARLDGGKAQPRKPRALVLTPTRELAMQVSDELLPLAKSLGLWCRTAVGGMAFGKPASSLRKSIDLLIANPGRIADHLRRGTCDLSEITTVALDEADQMADMGFMPQVREILDQAPTTGQRLLFSATLDGDVSELIERYLTDPVTHSVAPATANITTMEHHLMKEDRRDKQAVVTEIGAREGRTIMFVRTKQHVDTLTERLRSNGVHAVALHGGKTQGQRNRVLNDFKTDVASVLVATDVAARGIHVDNISLVLHVDPPSDPKDYLHRAGRTARAGNSGTVVTLFTHDQRRGGQQTLQRPDVRPSRATVRSGENELATITGARTPSGVPVVDPPRKPARKPARNGPPPKGRGKPSTASRKRNQAAARSRRSN